MTTQDAEFAGKITRHLDAGAASLRQGTAYGLQAARQRALARLAAPERQQASELVLAGGSARATRGSSRGFWLSARLWIGIVLIVAAGVGYQQWQSQQQVRDLEETDAAILTSDLPIDAYVDRGFQNWLTHADE